jgi:hypothetical protein
VLVLPVAPAGVQYAPEWTSLWTPLADEALAAAAEAEALAALAEAEALAAPAEADALALAALLAADDAADEAADEAFALTEAAAEAACVTDDDATLFADEQPAIMTSATAAVANQVLTRTNLKKCSLNYRESVIDDSV